MLADWINQRPSEVRQQLQQSQMPVEEAPNDDDVRQSYNFAPGYHGLVYRAEGSGHDDQKEHEHDNEEKSKKESTTETKYKLQSMQWGRYCKLLFECHL